MSLLLLPEKQNKLLLRNTEARPIGTTVPKSHVAKISNVKPEAYKHGKNYYKLPTLVEKHILNYYPQ